MKYNFLAAAASLAGIFFILWRKIPVLVRLEERIVVFGQPIRRRINRNLTRNFQIYRFAHLLMVILEKMLRKLKVMFLKSDNLISNWLESVKMKSRNFHFKSQYVSFLGKRGNEFNKTKKDRRLDE